MTTQEKSAKKKLSLLEPGGIFRTHMKPAAFEEVVVLMVYEYPTYDQLRASNEPRK